jgi:hypothetical protein
MATDAGDFTSFATTQPAARPQVPGNSPNPYAMVQAQPQPQSSRPVPPRTYDTTFDMYRGDIPLEYLRALAIVSGGGDFKPNQSANDTVGMFAISTSVLDGYNQQFGTSYRASDLADIQVNTKVAVWMINNVTKYYSLHYPRSLGQNWRNSDYVAIVTLGFKLGYSENGGIGDAIKVIDSQYPDKMNVDTIAQVAQAKGLASYLYAPSWIQWAKSVTNLYAGSPHTDALQTPRGSDAAVNQTSRQSGGRGIGGAGIAFIAAIPILAFAFSGKKR